MSLLLLLDLDLGVNRSDLLGRLEAASLLQWRSLQGGLLLLRRVSLGQVGRLLELLLLLQWRILQLRWLGHVLLLLNLLLLLLLMLLLLLRSKSDRSSDLSTSIQMLLLLRRSLRLLMVKAFDIR